MLSNEYPCLVGSTKEFIIGVEYEIEAVKDYKRIGDHPMLHNVEKDGSLRNNGYEFITRPLTYKDSLSFFKTLHSSLGYDSKHNPFSERTSTHVHLNVGGLDAGQARHFVLIYAMLEPYFFALVAKHRRHNIHCVPLEFTALSNKYKESLAGMMKSWSKYTAFNLLPISKQCTIEFRHLEGTDNYEKFEFWINTIKSLYDFVLTNDSFHLGKFLSEGGTVKELFTLVFKRPLTLPTNDFIGTTINVKESFV